jgi:hypothetical protein
VIRFIFKSDYKSVTTSHLTRRSSSGPSPSLPRDVFSRGRLHGGDVLSWSRRFGLPIRATAQDKDAATLMGVKAGRITVVTFGLGLWWRAGTLLVLVLRLPDLGGRSPPGIHHHDPRGLVDGGAIFGE